MSLSLHYNVGPSHHKPLSLRLPARWTEFASSCFNTSVGKHWRNPYDDVGLGKTVQVTNFIFKFKKLLFETF